jgi:hypothetical protein
VEHLKGASRRWALALLANIIQDWKGLPRTNTLTYYEHYNKLERLSLASPFAQSNVCGQGQEPTLEMITLKVASSLTL